MRRPAKGLPPARSPRLLALPPLMTTFRLLVIAVLLSGSRAGSADATSPVDAGQRNQPFAPSGVVRPPVQAPAPAAGLQDRVVEKQEFEKKAAAGVSDRRAPFEVNEARDKPVVTPEVRPAEAVPRLMSPLDHRPAALTTGETVRPPTVAKYQDGLTAASAANLARFPADGAATTAKVNRFVFRKNGGEASPVTGGAPVTKAGGRTDD